MEGNSEKIAHIIWGCSASGKSTIAANILDNYLHQGYDGVILERDEIRKSILKDRCEYSHDVNFWSQWKFTKENEAQVTQIFENCLEAYIKQDQFALIISDTNLQEKYRLPLIKRLEEAGFTVIVQRVDEEYRTLLERDSKRKDSVGQQVIARQYAQWLRQVYSLPEINNNDLPRAIICDIDGTIARMTGRSPYDWHRVGEDAVIDEVANAVVGLADQSSAELIFLSGRDSVCRDETLNWISEKAEFGYSFHLFMREKDDMRKDIDVKFELYRDNIHGKYNVIAVFDDRPQVCRLWRALGLTTFQVGDPHIEF
jgi:predicted kinase